MNIRDSKKVKSVILADKKGYKILKDGSVVGTRGKKLKLFSRTERGLLAFSIKSKELGGISSVNVHQYQAYQKFGLRAFEKNIQVRHLNGDCTDNSWSNIDIGTPSENSMDIPEHERKERALIAGRGNSSLSEHDVKIIRFLREKHKMKYSQILKIYPMSKSTLSYICNNKTWVEC